MAPLSTQRRLLMLALVLASFVSGIGSGRADELDDIAKAGVLKVGIFESIPPFVSVGADMQRQGYDIDVANRIAKAMNVKLEFVPITGQTLVPTLLEHKANILLSVGASEERGKIVSFSDAYAPYYIAVIGPRALAVKGLPDLVGKSVAVNRGTLGDRRLTEIMSPGTDIQRFNDYAGVISAFTSGQAQLMVVGNDIAANLAARHLSIEPEQKFPLMSSDDHIGINKDQPALIAKVNATIAEMKADGSLNAICLKWLLQPLPANL